MTTTGSNDLGTSAAEDRFIGSLIDDKYRIVELVACGGMGRVYRAVQVALDREVAVKLLDMRALLNSRVSEKSAESFRHRFFIEAASLAKLNHPNTVVVHDYGQCAPDVYFIAMELLRGKTLLKMIEEEGAIDYRRVARIALQICDSVADAHQQEFVHRDLKPSNVMITSRGEDDLVKVLDFGLVKRAKEDDSELTQSGAMVGTPRYMPPEQIERGEVGPQSDIYALGACLYHALAGYPPFQADSKFRLMMAHLESEPKPMNQDGGRYVPPDLEAVVLRCMRKKPDDRYGSMRELAEAISQASGVDRAASWRPAATSMPPPPLETEWDGETEYDRAPRLYNYSRSSLFSWGIGAASVLVLASVGLRVVPAGEPRAAMAPGVPIDPHQRILIEPVMPSIIDRAIRSMASDEGQVPPAEVVPTHEVFVQTVPAGADVRYQGELLGETPLRVEIPDGEVWRVSLRAEGYERRSVRLEAERESVKVRLKEKAAPSRPRADESSVVQTAKAEPKGEPKAEPKRESQRTRPSGATKLRETDNRDPWADES